MTLVKATLKKMETFKKKLQDKKTQEKVKNTVKQGIKDGKAKLGQMKEQFKAGEKKAVSYTKSNPRKALAVATAAGIVAGTALAMMRRKKAAKV